MEIARGKPLELHIDSVAFGGPGVARVEGFVVFVKGALPGDRVLARVARKKRSHAEAVVEEVLTPSPDRVEAPCPYFGHCGGCQWQHAKYESQLSHKKSHVSDAMARIGMLAGVPIRDVIPSAEEYGYRNKMEFSFSRRRWLMPEEMGAAQGASEFALGLHVPGTFDKVLDVEACLLQPETGNRILRVVKRFARESGMPAYEFRSHQGFWRFLTVRRSRHSDAWMVNVITSEENRALLDTMAREVLGPFENVVTVVNNITSRKASVAVGEREILLRGAGLIEDRLGPFIFQISANSFFQTNSLTAERLYTQVKEYAELKGTELVLDLYSGTGTIPIFLSGSSGNPVVGMEINESAVLDAERNCRANGITNCRFVTGDIREALSTSRLKPDVIVIDPPRSGMHKDVLLRVMEMAAKRIVYVSCNPTTMARDLAGMAEGYEVAELQPVDMFPQTYHVEVVAKLVRKMH
ncbi:MAG: 23S rRNA (uracil(1939)-C(5))-methyltransferase RlmD [Thermodesulfobacteriota bacterium]